MANLDLDLNYEILDYDEEYTYTTKIFESDNKTEYRKSLQDIPNFYLTLSFKALTQKQLKKLENIMLERIDKQINLIFLESYIIDDYISNINNKKIKLYQKTINNNFFEKYNFNYTNIAYKNMIIDNGITKENFVAYNSNMGQVWNNQKQKLDYYWELKVGTFGRPITNYLKNNYVKGTRVYIKYLVEIQNKDINIKETYIKNGEIKLKLKIINNQGETI